MKKLKGSMFVLLALGMASCGGSKGSGGAYGGGAAVVGQDGTFGMTDASYVPTNATTIQVVILSQNGCQMNGGWTQGQRQWQGGQGWRRHGVWGLRGIWNRGCGNNNQYGGNQYGSSQVPPNQFPNSPYPNGQYPGQYPTQYPNGSGAGGCLVKSVSTTYASGATLSITGLADGQYDVIVELDASNGAPVAGGSSSVSVYGGQMTPVSIALGPVPVPAKGGGSINVGVGNNPGTIPGYTPPATPGYTPPVTPGYTPLPNTPVPPAPGTTTGDRFVFTNPSVSGRVNSCVPLSIGLLDPSGNLTSAPTNVNVALTTSAATGSFYSDASCTARMSTTNIAANTGGVTLYYRDTAAGTPTLTVSDLSSQIGAASAIVTESP